jgi:cytochrome c biogenesis protein CcdA
MVSAVTAALVLAGSFAAGQDSPERMDHLTELPEAPLVVHVFYSSACAYCEEVFSAALTIQRRFGSWVQFEYWNVIVPENETMKRKYATYYGVSDQDSVAIPLIFVGRQYLAGHGATHDTLLAAIKDALAAGETTPKASYISEMAESFSQDVSMLTFPAVFMAGLADGVNPCAIATLVFFLTYLTACGWNRAGILWVGSMFTLGVFLAYLAAGLGLYQVVTMLDAVPWTRTAIRLTGAGMALALGVLSGVDAMRAFVGQSDRMVLILPKKVRTKIHKVVNKFMGRRLLPLSAFATAVVVSGLEFICTGQVYLPAIVFMRTQAEHRLESVYYLLTYNLAFIIPMTAIFIGAYLGITSRRMASMSRKSITLAKAATALILSGLGGYMLLDLL